MKRRSGKPSWHLLVLLCWLLISGTLFSQSKDSLKTAMQADTTMQLNTKEKQLILQRRTKEIKLIPSTTKLFRCQVINTNFTIPILRFNTVNKTGVDNNQRGNLSLFNSIGAGVSYNWGRMTITTDDLNNVINTEMNNTFGFQLGVLFAANSSSGNNANIFAPTFSLAILNFQIGCGYELGTISPKENRFFYTIAYGISLGKLIKGGYYVVKKSTPESPSAGFY